MSKSNHYSTKWFTDISLANEMRKTKIAVSKPVSKQNLGCMNLGMMTSTASWYKDISK